MTLSFLWALLKRTLSEWLDDRAPTFAASLAYYTLFSLAPMLVIALALAGNFFGRETANAETHELLREYVGPQGAQAISDMLVAAQRPQAGLIASCISVLVLLFGATGAFAELQLALNTVWGVEQLPRSGLREFVRTRFVSMVLVMGLGLLFLVSLGISLGLTAAGAWLQHRVDDGGLSLQVLNVLFSFASITGLFAVIFKWLPDRRVGWRDVWLGAVVAAVLFNIGKFLLGLYIAKSSIASAYGAAGSLAVLELWVFFSACVLLFGAELSQVYAVMVGSTAAPLDKGERVDPLQARVSHPSHSLAAQGGH